METLTQMFEVVKAIYSVVFDQKWYWTHLRPKLEGSIGWVEFAKTGLVVWLISLILTTALLPLSRLVATNLSWGAAYLNATENILLIAFLSLVMGLGSKNRVLWGIPTVVTLGTMSGFTPLLMVILSSPGIDLNLIIVILLVLAFMLAGCFGINSVVARGEGMVEMLLGMVVSSWRGIPESKAWSLLLGVTITTLVALLIVPVVVVLLHIGWKQGIGMQSSLIILTLFSGFYAGEKWASRQITNVTERKRLANCRE